LKNKENFSEIMALQLYKKELKMSRIKSKKYTGIYLNKLQDGDISYSFTYKDLYNNTKWVTVGKKSAGINEAYVNRKRISTISQVQLGEDPTAVKRKQKDHIHLDTLADRYFDAKEGINRDNSRQKRKYEHHIKTKLGRKNAHTITRSDVNKLRQGVINLGRAPKTVNSVIQLLSAIYNHNIKEEGLKIENPCSQVKPLPTDDHRERFLSTDEVKLLLNNLSNDDEAYLFVKLALSTGARKKGVLHIQKKDIDFNQGATQIYDAKRENTYTGFLDSETLDILKRRCKSLAAEEYVLGGKIEPLHRKVIERKIRPTMDRLFNQGLDTKDSKNRAVIHTLRHTFASHLAINGTSIFVIQKLMNHADIKHTMRYAKLLPDSGAENVRNLYA
jgi:integrase